MAIVENAAGSGQRRETTSKALQGLWLRERFVTGLRLPRWNSFLESWRRSHCHWYPPYPLCLQRDQSSTVRHAPAATDLSQGGDTPPVLARCRSKTLQLPRTVLGFSRQDFFHVHYLEQAWYRRRPALLNDKGDPTTCHHKSP